MHNNCTPRSNIHNMNGKTYHIKAKHNVRMTIERTELFHSDFDSVYFTYNCHPINIRSYVDFCKPNDDDRSKQIMLTSLKEFANSMKEYKDCVIHAYANICFIVNDKVFYHYDGSLCLSTPLNEHIINTWDKFVFLKEHVVQALENVLPNVLANITHDYLFTRQTERID